MITKINPKAGDTTITIIGYYEEQLVKYFLREGTHTSYRLYKSLACYY
jgi:hypothetical protein